MCIRVIDKCKSFAYNLFMISQKETIKSIGLRITPARIAVLKILEEHQGPLDIASIYKEVAKSHVDADQATIYRIIENFIDKDLVKRLQLQEKKFYYEISKKDHHHAVCNECGKIEDIGRCSMKRAERKLEEKLGFKTENHSLEFFGICKECRNNNL